ncbi:hypothetical protein EHS17_00350 [Rhodobacteraceae bacterium CH30]|nr:hypothetical protein EHS17_00350 [Rhodobacteraceae bacterium CH30]
MRTLMGLAVSAVVAAASVYAFSPRPMPEQAATMVRVDRMRFNDMAQLGSRLLAVGERGAIFASTDGGASWQAQTLDKAQSSALTSVHFLDDKQGVAVGGDNWILKTDDGGRHWRTVRFDAKVSEPLLGVWGVKGGPLFAFGSYGRFLASTDGGNNWAPQDVGIEDFHVNAMDGAADGQLMLVGEQGMAFRSSDGGVSWQKIAPFYNGSLFGVARIDAASWVAYGMRGNVFVTRDFGTNWHKLDLPLPVSLFGHARDASGRLLLVGQGGVVLQLAPDLSSATLVKRHGALSLTAIAPQPDNSLVVAGENGLYRIAAKGN